MTDEQFVDHYEVLHLSPTADRETLERVFRLLAKRYHPDNAKSGDADLFREIDTAYRVLSDPERRAAYDARYDNLKGVQWNLYEHGSAMGVQEQDRRIFHGVLSLLYVARRRDPEAGGLGGVHLEQMLGIPREHLEFPIWYLRRRGWVEVLNNGQYAITVEGIDKIASKELSVPENRLLPETSEAVGDERSGPENGGPEALDMPRPTAHTREAEA